jgi:hypothetical protein
VFSPIVAPLGGSFPDNSTSIASQIRGDSGGQPGR